MTFQFYLKMKTIFNNNFFRIKFDILFSLYNFFIPLRILVKYY